MLQLDINLDVTGGVPGCAGPKNGGTVPYEAKLFRNIPLHSPYRGPIYIYIHTWYIDSSILPEMTIDKTV